MINRDTHKGQVQEIKRLLEFKGGWVWALAQAARLYGSAGLPDMFCIYKDRAFWVEVKVGRDKLSPAQVSFKAASEAAGIPVIVGRAGEVADWMVRIEAKA